MSEFIIFAKFKFMKHIILLLISSLILNGSRDAFGQKKLNDYFDHLFQQQKFMGSVAIMHNDSLLYSKAVGYSDFGKKKVNHTYTRFRIGSLTKTFSAALVLKAVEEQKLHLNDVLKKYYPELKNADKITIQQLLQHRSGIFNFTEKDDARAWEQRDHSEKEFIQYIATEKSNFEPGTAYEYSNTNYALLGFILQKIYHKPFAKILEEKICKPLHLQNTYYSFETDPGNDEALSYNIQNTYLGNAKVNFSNHPASGGIVSTPADVNKFLFALFNGKLIQPKTLKTMLPVEKGAYGMGIQKLTFDQPSGYEHGGRVENYFSDYWYFPKENLGIVILSNAININMDAINLVLLKYAYGGMPELPNFNQIKDLSEVEFTKIKGTYMDQDNKESVTISSDGHALVFQSSVTGQDYVSFTSKGNGRFEYADIELQFLPHQNEVLLKQGATETIYRKK